MYTIYLCIYGVLLILRVAQKNAIKSIDVYDEDEEDSDKSSQTILFAIDIAYIGIILVIACMLIVSNVWKDEVIRFFNLMVQYDEYMEGKRQVCRNLFYNI